MDRWLGLARSLIIYHNPATIRGWRRFYGQILRRGDVAFDVGAHVGTRARAMRKAGAKVIALEPQSLFASYLRLTLPKDIILLESAVGASDSVAEMAVSSRHPTVSSMQSKFVVGAATAPGFDHVQWDSVQSVQMVTLDGLIERYGLPNYIKIDVEGFELEVLSGLSRPVPLLSVEFLPGFPDLTFAVLDRIEELARYQYNPVVGEKAEFLWPEWRNGAAMREWLAGLPADAVSGDVFARVVQD
ncbi:FkbM family methyltransferase [Roseinatronobacter sp.]|uniref:FkbM family methyltransferase n=1 Tax=Roseinatronobacter sp. TaxID=1945755 RepID=UPI0025F92EB4|nr:FkbM family methyltransferase [Rhodobaca sp.]